MNSSGVDEICYNLRSRPRKSRKLDTTGKKPGDSGPIINSPTPNKENVRLKKTTQEKNDGPVASAEDDGAPVTEKLSLVEDNGGSVTEKASVMVNPRAFGISKGPPPDPNFPRLSSQETKELIKKVFSKHISSREEIPIRNAAITWAIIALEQYNSTRHSNFKFKGIKAVKGSSYTSRLTIHLNFIAEPEDGASSKLFFVDMYAPAHDYLMNRYYDVQVKLCCVLEKLDSDMDPNCSFCKMCFDSVDHPSPRYGYCCDSGDDVADSVFRNEAFNSEKTCERINVRAVAITWANKALEQYNSNKHVNFKLKEIKAVKAANLATTVHMNFIAESDVDALPKLFYADICAPYACCFRNQDYDMEVVLCCIMEKLDSGIDPNSTICKLCSDGVDHPSPRYGYCSDDCPDFKLAK